jgi:hypothetical protein
MHSQPELEFPAPTARGTDPNTSHGAAIVAIHRAQSGRDAALRALCESDTPLSDFDLERITGIKQTSIGKRRGDLVTAELVTRAFLLNPDTGDRVWVNGVSPTGTTCCLWEPTPAGRDLFVRLTGRAS